MPQKSTTEPRTRQEREAPPKVGGAGSEDRAYPAYESQTGRSGAIGGLALPAETIDEGVEGEEPAP